ncbi:MAG: hypothetical protein M1816_006221 [Peltula sp. TS41687]|nr:MAG: hypothetical protein M1816_006221 [Peltula sp. TS41687]
MQEVVSTYLLRKKATGTRQDSSLSPMAQAGQMGQLASRSARSGRNDSDDSQDSSTSERPLSAPVKRSSAAGLTSQSPLAPKTSPAVKIANKRKPQESGKDSTSDRPGEGTANKRAKKNSTDSNQTKTSPRITNISHPSNPTSTGTSKRRVAGHINFTAHSEGTHATQTPSGRQENIVVVTPEPSSGRPSLAPSENGLKTPTASGRKCGLPGISVATSFDDKITSIDRRTIEEIIDQGRMPQDTKDGNFTVLKARLSNWTQGMVAEFVTCYNRELANTRERESVNRPRDSVVESQGQSAGAGPSTLAASSAPMAATSTSLVAAPSSQLATPPTQLAAIEGQPLSNTLNGSEQAPISWGSLDDQIKLVNYYGEAAERSQDEANKHRAEAERAKEGKERHQNELRQLREQTELLRERMELLQSELPQFDERITRHTSDEQRQKDASDGLLQRKETAKAGLRDYFAGCQDKLTGSRAGLELSIIERK